MEGKTINNIIYMFRHLLNVNIDDPLPDDERGYTKSTQYFSGTGNTGQINYLEGKPTTNGSIQVWSDGVLKVTGTDYTYDRSNAQIVWDQGFNPDDGKSNIKVKSQHIKRWIYDDHPILSQSHWPRMTVDLVSSENETYGVGEYLAYGTGVGNMITCNFNVILRFRKNNNYYTHNGYKLKNMDLINNIIEQIMDYINENRSYPPWLFWDWSYNSSTRRREEEMEGILRKDIDITIKYFDRS